MNRNESESRFDELDRQIRAALHVEPSSRQLDRLEAFWRQQSHADHRRRRSRRVAAMAATILIVLAASYQLWHGPSAVAPHEDLLTQADPATSAPSDDGVPEQASAEPIAENAHSISLGRPASTYEQFVFTARVHQREIARQRSAVIALEKAIDRLARDPNADARQLLEPADLKTVSAERLLLRQLNRSDDPRKRAILQLLAVCGTSQSTAPLLNLSRRPAMCEQALKAIEQAVGIDGLANAATLTGDPRVRTAIYRRLFGNEATLDAYLSLVQNDFLRDEVLAVADELSQPMLDALLIRLSAEDQDTRLAAAFVLGHANGPIVTDSLIALVSEDRASPTEAWIALMACRGRQADQFLTYVTHQPRLLGHFNRARAYWARTIH